MPSSDTSSVAWHARNRPTQTASRTGMGGRQGATPPTRGALRVRRTRPGHRPLPAAATGLAPTGPKKAAHAIAPSLLVAVCPMLRSGGPHREPGRDGFTRTAGAPPERRHRTLGRASLAPRDVATPRDDACTPALGRIARLPTCVSGRRLGLRPSALCRTKYHISVPASRAIRWLRCGHSLSFSMDSVQIDFVV